jgi:AcrR family transcriptional regulator
LVYTQELRLARHKPDTDTRASLLEAAWDLFSEGGYQATSVNAVIDRAGLSKGTFYHWFDSKEALLDSVVNSMLERSVSHTREAMPGPLAPAVERLNGFLATARRWGMANAPGLRAVLVALHHHGNGELLRRMRRRSAQVAMPMLVDILEQGQREGSMDIDDPPMVAELLLRMGNARSDAEVADLIRGEPGAVDRCERRAQLHFTWLERGLGLQPGSLSVGDDFRALFEAFIEGRPT